jgi:outer membrane protein assembly factor BamB
MRITVGTDTQAASPAGPVELPPGAWEAPPVRGPGGAFGSDPGLAAPSGAESKLTPQEKARRRARRIIAALFVVLAAAGVVAAWIIRGAAGQAEDDRYQEARKEYRDKNFADAVTRFRALQKEYPGSSRRAAYQFFADLSALRQPVYTSQARPKDMKEAYQRLRRFLDDHKDHPLLKEVRADIRDTLFKVVERLTPEGEDQVSDPDLLALARRVFKKAKDFGDRKADDQEQAAADRIDAAKAGLRKQEKTQEVVLLLKKLVRTPSGDAVREARLAVKRAEREQPGLGARAEVVNLLGELMDGHRAEVKYIPVRKPPRARAPAEDPEPSLLVAPAVGGLGFRPWARQSPVLALARGVLYALRPSDGSVRWATRVGVDTTVLPVRLPPRRATGELILVVSADTNTLSALDAADGSARWHHRLAAPCLGKPTVVGARVYVPCDDGRVDELEAYTGKLLGYYRLGQHLSHGGAYDADSRLLYLAADSYCVYALDLDKKRCAAILYSEHPSGTLRSAPILVHWKDVPAGGAADPDAPRSCLVLNQADGLEATRLRVFALPLEKPDAAPLPLELRVRGWSWFPPFQDDEKLGLATDEGVIGLFGIKQKKNRDKLLFPMLDKEYVLEGGGDGPPEGRAQLVYFDDSNLWALAHGELHRLQLTLGPGGWQLARLWETPVFLGAPLHAGRMRQIPADRLGRTRKVLYFVTRPGPGQTCVASAVDAEAEGYVDNKVRWQTQLGLMCQGEPVRLKGAVFAQDQGGGLFRFEDEDDPLQESFRLAEDLLDIPAHDADAAWHIHERRAAEPLKREGARPLGLLPVAGGAYALVAVGGEETGRLVVRHFDATRQTTTDHPCTLPAAPAGTPGAWPDHLVFPLANGVLARKQLSGGAAVLGPNWRARGADDNAPGYVVPLSATDFLATDGSRGLIHLSWPEDNDDCREKARTELPARIVAPPLVVNAGANEFRVFVADADNRVTMLTLEQPQGERKGGFDPEVRRLQLDGPITAGPFPLGKGVGCVVAHRRLVLLDAEKNKPLWAGAYRAGADVVGRPAVVGGLVIVADLDGRFVGLDPATGKPRGKGYKLRANVAPACTPVAYGDDRLFAPLTDGTVLLLALRRLETPSK